MARFAQSLAVVAWTLLVSGVPGPTRADDEVVTLDDGPDDHSAPDERRARLGPLAPPRNSFFYAALGQPHLHPAWNLSEGDLDLRLRASEVRSHVSKVIDGQPNRFDGYFHEYARLEMAVGIHERVELYTFARFAGWGERRDTFLVFTGGPFPSVEGEREKILTGRHTGRHENIADWAIGQKFEILESADGLGAIGASVEVTLPVSRKADLTNAGTTDLALTVLASRAFGPVAFHANAGVVFPFGAQTIFVDVDPGLSDFGHFAGGVTFAATDWLSLGAQVHAATSAWRDVPLLDHAPATVTAGARFARGRFTVEVGGGTGLTELSADVIAWLEVGYRFRAVFGPER